MSLQDTYGLEPAIAYPGMVADMSPATILSRTLVGAAIGFGRVVAPGTVDHTCRAIGDQTYDVAQAAVAGNTGNGVLTLATPAYGAGVKAGVYKVTMIEPATNGGTFTVEDPNGVQVGTGNVAAAFDGEVKFTIADGATDFVAGDAFNVTVTEDAADAMINDVLGITVRSRAVRIASTVDQYAVGDSVTVLAKGPIFVTAGATVEPRGPVFYTISTGRFAHTGDLEIPNAKFMTSATIGGLVKLHLL